MAAEFVREERYVVIKIKDLDEYQKAALYNLLDNLKIVQRDSVVVEADWPEYERVWEMIERRVVRGHLVGGISYYPEAME